jgi:hypothetical protein
MNPQSFALLARKFQAMQDVKEQFEHANQVSDYIEVHRISFAEI